MTHLYRRDSNQITNTLTFLLKIGDMRDGAVYSVTADAEKHEFLCLQKAATRTARTIIAEIIAEMGDEIAMYQSVYVKGQEDGSFDIIGRQIDLAGDNFQN